RSATARSSCFRSSKPTASARGRPVPTPSDETRGGRAGEPAADRRLASALAALDLTTLRATGRLAFVRARAAAVHEALRAFSKGVPGESSATVAVLAVGGYGRRELFPGSDVDLVILHEEGAHRLAERAAEALLYPLWNLGMVTGNAVRTVAECAEAAEADPRALTALLSARRVAGSEDLFADLNVVVDRACRRDQAHFVGLLQALRERRRGRFGYLSHATEPELKEPLGGMRDVATLAWLTRAGLPVPSAARLADPAEALRRVRVALQLHTGTRSNRLEASDHEGVAQALGLSGDADWEARDALVREVLRAGRAIDVLVDEALAEATAASAVRPTKAARPAVLATALESAPPARLAA